MGPSGTRRRRRGYYGWDSRPRARWAIALFAALASAAGAGLAACGDDGDAAPRGTGDGSVDVAAPLEAAAPVDAGVDDASANVGPDALDAGRDVGPPKDAGAFCATLSPKPTFCDDFDGLDVPQVWDQRLAVAGSSVARDGAEVTSGSLALLATSKTTSTGEPVTALVRKTIAGTPSTVRFAFAMRPEAVQPTLGVLWYATLDLSTAHLFTFYLRDPSGGPALVEQAAGGIEVRTPLPLPPKDAWTRVAIDADLVAKTLTVRYDGAAVIDAVPIVAGVQDPTIRLGVLGNGPAAAYAVRFDDVVLDGN